MILYYAGVFFNNIIAPDILCTNQIGSNIGDVVWQVDPQNSKRFYTDNQFIIGGLMANKCVLVGQTCLQKQDEFFYQMQLEADIVNGMTRAVITCYDVNLNLVEAPFNYTTVKIEIYP